MTIFNKYYMIVIDQERRMVMARGTRYSQEFKEDAVRYRLEQPEEEAKDIALSLELFVNDVFCMLVGHKSI